MLVDAVTSHKEIEKRRSRLDANQRSHSPRGQVTIFIIVAVIIIALVILFFLFKKQILGNILPINIDNPERFIEECIDKDVLIALNEISSQGGYFSNPLNKTFTFEDEGVGYDISYLCYNQNYYYPCVNQEPLLINHLKEEIKNRITVDVKNCFDKLAETAEDAGYGVEANYDGYDISLQEGKLIIYINGGLSFFKGDSPVDINNLEVAIPTRFYDNALVVQEIVNQEAKYCNFEPLGFMMYYQDYDISKFRTGESDKIYTVKSRKTGEWFRFMIRSCAIPPGR